VRVVAARLPTLRLPVSWLEQPLASLCLGEGQPVPVPVPVPVPQQIEARHAVRLLLSDPVDRQFQTLS